MKKWQVKDEENIADIVVEIFGKTEEDLLNNLIKAFTSIITKVDKIKEKEEYCLKITNDNFSDLVFDFVEKLIYLKDVKGLLFKKGKFVLKKNGELNLTTVLLGEKISQKLPIKVDVKAITRHKFQVKKEKDKFKATIVFDI